jgi:hypothetical protein
MSCVLRVSGADFDVDEFLAGSPLKALVTVHRGDERVQANRPAFRYESSGMNVSISTREFSDLSSQVDDAVRFLTDNVRELKRLKEFPGVQTMHLDFPIQDRDAVFQKDVFPPQLLARMGELNIGLIVSRYPVPDGQQT